VLKIDERDLWSEGVYFEEQKTGKEIIVAWTPDLSAWVAACKALRGKVERVAFEVPDRARPLLRGRGGKKPDYSTIGRQFRRALAAARVNGEPVPHGTIHDGRAFSATEAKRQGHDPQKLLNHTDASTTRIYLRGREIEVVDGPRIKRKIG
jgi:integrase